MWERACASEELKQGSAMVYKHVVSRIGIFRTESGLFAIDNTCPHYEAELHYGEIREGKVLCPWHRWRFELATGRCDTGKAFDVACYPVKEEDGSIWVDVAAGQAPQRETF